MKRFLYILSIILLLGLTACSPKEPKSFGREVFALDTMSTFTIWTNDQVDEKRAEELTKEAELLVLYYENLLSRTIETSDVWRLNHAHGQEVDINLKTAWLIEESIRYSELTGGNFDISILPVKEVWDFKADHPSLPSQEDIEKAKALVNYKNIDLGTEIFEGENPLIKNPPLPGQEEKVAWRKARLKGGTTIDLGAIAKGYIADMLSDYFKSQGITKGIINLGGNVLMIGEKEPGIPWKVGVQNPDGAQNSYIATVSINDQSVVTSGVYERFFEIDGVKYHHLLNPFTGRPTDNGLLSTTILSEESVVGDALSTSCFALGLDKGMELIENTPGVEGVFILENGDIIKSSGVDKYNFTAN